jgi:hypothetical protein
VRFVLVSACLLVAALHPIVPLAQSAAGCSIGGTVTSTRTPLPGVVVSVLDADRTVDVSASGVDGVYTLKIPGPGRYIVKAEFIAFAPVSRELTVDQAACQARVAEIIDHAAAGLTDADRADERVEHAIGLVLLGADIDELACFHEATAGACQQPRHVGERVIAVGDLIRPNRHAGVEQAASGRGDRRELIEHAAEVLHVNEVDFAAQRSTVDDRSV